MHETSCKQQNVCVIIHRGTVQGIFIIISKHQSFSPPSPLPHRHRRGRHAGRQQQ
jgi:hypothetical protein